jgi:heme oxygenase
LKIATGPIHERVESSFNLQQKLSSIATYRVLLERLLGLHRPLEATLGRLDWSDRGIDLSGRQKSRWLEQDLRDLGHSNARLSRVLPCPLPRVVGKETALGWLYTVEGASLGGRVILGEARRRLGVSEEWAGRFFSGYGAQTAAAWRDFTAVLNEIDARSPSADAVVQGAKDMFLIYGEWVARPGRQDTNDARGPQETLLV